MYSTRLRPPAEAHGNLWRTVPIQPAFTLIELLVVIAIISLLVSILLPSLRKAKELAKGTVCQMQERNLHLSWSMHMNDSEGEHVRMTTYLTDWKQGY